MAQRFVTDRYNRYSQIAATTPIKIESSEAEAKPATPAAPASASATPPAPAPTIVAPPGTLPAAATPQPAPAQQNAQPPTDGRPIRIVMAAGKD